MVAEQERHEREVKARIAEMRKQMATLLQLLGAKSSLSLLQEKVVVVSGKLKVAKLMNQNDI